MRDASWFILRLSVTRAYLAISLLLAGPALFTAPGTRAAAVTAGLTNSRDLAVFLVPAYVAAVWGALGDNGVDATWRLAGVNPRAQRWRALAATVGYAILGLAVVAVAYGSVPTDSVDGGAVSGVAEVRRSATYLVLTLAGVVASVVVVVRDRGRGPAMAAALGIPLVHIVVAFGHIPGRLLWLACWPTSAGGFIARGDEDYPDVLRLVASISLATVMAFMFVTMDRTRTSLHSRRRRRRMPSDGGRLGAIAVALMALLAAAVGGALPTLASSLPAESRPSLLIQSADGRAPADVADLFYQLVRQGDLEEAGELALGGEVAATPGVERVVALSGAASFELVESPDLTHAEVRGQVGLVAVCIRLVYDLAAPGAYRWLVESARQGECLD